MKEITTTIKNLFEKKALLWALAIASFVMLSGFGFNTLLNNTLADNARFINAWAYEEELNDDDAQPTSPTYTHGGSDNTVVIREGQDIKLKWRPQDINATSCSASGDWSGSKNHTTTTEEVAVSSASAGDYSFEINCDTPDGQKTDSINVSVLGDPAGVTIAAWAYDESLNGDDSVPNPGYTGGGDNNTVVIREGEDVKLKWFPENATSCTASGDWSGSKSPNTGATENLGAKAPGTYGYTINCSNASGSDSDTINVEVLSDGGGSCNPNPSADLVVVGGSMMKGTGTGIDLINGEQQATAQVKNNSSNCTYSVGMASYQVFVPAGSSNQDFIDSQQLFDDQFKDIAPGETKTFIVDVPACIFQVDVFEGPKVSPVPPDFANLPNYTLLDFRIETEGREVCGEKQCPSDFDGPVIGGASNVTVTPGQSFSYPITVTGDGQISFTVSSLPSFLSYNSSTKTVTGTIPNNFVGPVSFEIDAEAVDLESGLVCGVDQKTVTLTTDQCPVDAPTITGNANASGEVGQAFSYTFSTTGEVSNIQVSNLPNGITRQGNTLVGTPTQAGIFNTVVTVSNQCGQDTLNVRIVISDGQCPVDAPTITGNANASGEVGQAFSYTFSTTGVVENIQVSNLPNGITRQGNTLVGTPTQAGIFNTVVTVSNECGQDTLNIKIIIDEKQKQCPVDFEDPNLESNKLINANPGSNVNYLVEVSGDGNIKINVSDLPSWLTYNSSTRRVTGTVPDENPYSFTISLEATDPGTDLVCGDNQFVVNINSQCPLEIPDITSTTSRNITEGSNFSYTITYTGGEPIDVTVSSLPSWLTFNRNSKVISGVVPDESDYSFQIRVENVCGRDVQTVSLNNDDGGGGGGGGGRRVDVDVQSTLIPAPEGEVLSSFVTLAQVPYTGIGGTLQSILFMFGLLVISAGIAYLLISRQMKEKIAGVFSSEEIRGSYNDYESADDSYEDNHYASMAGVGTMPAQSDWSAMGGVGNITRHREEVDNRFNEIQRGALSTAGDVDPTDLSSRLAQDMNTLAKREKAKENEDRTKDSAQSNKALEKRLEDKAREDQVLISDDGLALLSRAANGDEKNALPILTQLITVADEWYAREDGWLLLNKSKVKEILFATYLMMAPVFIGWIAEGNQKKAFGFLRMLRSQEHSVKEFVKHVVYEMDALYRFRMDGEVEKESIDDHTLKVTRHWSTGEIEKMIEVLVGSVDESYSNDFTPIKLSILRLFSISRDAIRQSTPRLTSSK